MCRYLLAFLLATTGVGRAVADERCPRDPGKAAQQLYENHQEFIFVGASSPPLTADFASLINTSLAAQARAGESGPIDWNYWTDAQDGEQSKTSTVVSVRSSRARARVTLAYEFHASPGARGQPKRANVKLVRTGEGCWLVDDLLRGGQSVASYLRPPNGPAAKLK